ncbi:hypothetical protein [Actinoplanes sp. NBRC 103695]|uniref:hypothetical protein n=1 Tax=Actinoplanes sp. NBRC 103695 TaxID=3032202 RepID=UPI00255712F8|nr:hypothetical protein [Actinoplanes sp. NBRC 103695]GLY99332.1 hypothetical protein Acsp02_65850 [Actinoplanes sp. NBRC 103695]
MSDRGRRSFYLLVGSWAGAAVSVLLFAWLTTDSYVTSQLTPLPGESQRTIQECTASACAPDAAGLISKQLVALSNTKSLAYDTAWAIAILAAAFVLAASVLFLRRQHHQAASFLNVAWKVLAGATVLVLVSQLVNLIRHASELTGIPSGARTFTYANAFTSPLTNFGHVYYLGWLVAVLGVTALLMRSLQLSLTTGR